MIEQAQEALFRVNAAVFGVDASETNDRELSDLSRLKSRSVSRDDASALRVLGSLLGAGMSVDRALGVLALASRGRWQTAAPRARSAVREGSSLSTALNGAAGLPPAVLGLLRSGEASGRVAKGVQRAADLMEESVAARSALRSAMAYPLLLAVASLTAMTLMITIVVPKFGAILRDTGGTLPDSTRFLLGFADTARALLLPACALLIAVLIVHRAQLATPTGRIRWHRWLLHLPLIGGIRQAAATARFCETLGALLEGGVKLPAALSGAGQAAGDDFVQSVCDEARTRVIAGAALSAALGATPFLSPIAANLLRAGEEAGAVAAMLTHAGRMEAQRARDLTSLAVRFVEPALILVFGGAVALIAAALLQAVYSVRPLA